MRNNKPIVSIIVPNYNHALFLRERIDSILRQNFQDFELIILDDCSTDNSKDIIESYRANPHVSQIIYNTENSGSPFKQWCKGIEVANGDYIWIAESDDTSLPEFLTTLVSQLNNYPNSVLAFSHSYFIDYKGDKLNIDYHHNSNGNFIIYNSQKFTKNILTKGNFIYNASMAIFRRSAYFKIQRVYYRNFHSCGDWAFWMEICLQGHIIEICKKLNCFRQHQNKVTTKASKTENDWQEVSNILSNFIDILQLRGIPLHLFRGKWTRDLLFSNIKDKSSYIKKYPMLYGGTKFDIFLYKLSTIPYKIRFQDFYHTV